MRKKRRQAVRVFGREFDLLFEARPAIEEDDVMGGFVEVTGKRPLIAVDINRPLDVQRETLLHELLHVSDVTTGGGVKQPEKLIDRLARALYGVGRDNQALMLWIFCSEDDEDETESLVKK